MQSAFAFLGAIWDVRMALESGPTHVPAITADLRASRQLQTTDLLRSMNQLRLNLKRPGRGKRRSARLDCGSA